VNPRYVPRIHFYDSKDVAREVSAGKSLIRLGDGEIHLLNHGDIPFERSTPKLRSLMMASITEYNVASPYIVALNKAPLQKSNRELNDKGLLECWLPSKVYYNLYFNHKASYADAALFYFKDTIPKYFETYLLTKQILFVSNSRSCAAFKENQRVPFPGVNFIETPETGSFGEYDRIKSEVVSCANKAGKDKVVVLAAFGPASKVLAYELSKIGIQVLDVGQGITAAYTDADHSLSENIRVLQ
jgi:Glycosyltransferase GT-D fold